MGRSINPEGVPFNVKILSEVKDGEKPRTAAEICDFVLFVRRSWPRNPRFAESVVPIREHLEVAYTKVGVWNRKIKYITKVGGAELEWSENHDVVFE